MTNVGGEVVRGMGGGAAARSGLGRPARAGIHGLDPVSHEPSLVSVAQSPELEALRPRIPQSEFREKRFWIGDR